MVSSTEGSQIRRFKIVGVIGVFVLPLIGVLLTLATGWSPWITYGVPLVIAILATLPLLLAARREQAEIGNAKPEPNTKNGR